MTEIVTIAGSPSHSAKSSVVLEYAQTLLRRQGARTSAIAVRKLPAEDLLFARSDSPAIQTARCTLDGADGVVIATPVYKAAYSGVLKAFLDMLPQNALAGKTILPIATGGSLAHLLALDYALKPVLAALGATHILQGVYVTDAQIQFAHGGALQLDDEIEQRLRASLTELVGGRGRAVRPAPDDIVPLLSPALALSAYSVRQRQQANMEDGLLFEGFQR